VTSRWKTRGSGQMVTGIKRGGGGGLWGRGRKGIFQREGWLGGAEESSRESGEKLGRGRKKKDNVGFYQPKGGGRGA